MVYIFPRLFNFVIDMYFTNRPFRYLRKLPVCFWWALFWLKAPVMYICVHPTSEEFLRRAVYHKVYVLKFFCKTKIWGPIIWGIV